MRNPVNSLATAAPRALDSLLVSNQNNTKNKKSTASSSSHQEGRQERSWSFDLMGIDILDDAASTTNTATTSVGGGGEGSVVTFEDLSSDFTSCEFQQVFGTGAN